MKGFVPGIEALFSGVQLGTSAGVKAVGNGDFAALLLELLTWNGPERSLPQLVSNGNTQPGLLGLLNGGDAQRGLLEDSEEGWKRVGCLFRKTKEEERVEPGSAEVAPLSANLWLLSELPEKAALLASDQLTLSAEPGSVAASGAVQGSGLLPGSAVAEGVTFTPVVSGSAREDPDTGNEPWELGARAPGATVPAACGGIREQVKEAKPTAPRVDSLPLGAGGVTQLPETTVGVASPRGPRVTERAPEGGDVFLEGASAELPQAEEKREAGFAVKLPVAGAPPLKVVPKAAAVEAPKHVASFGRVWEATLASVRGDASLPQASSELFQAEGETAVRLTVELPAAGASPSPLSKVVAEVASVEAPVVEPDSVNYVTSASRRAVESLWGETVAENHCAPSGPEQLVGEVHRGVQVGQEEIWTPPKAVSAKAPTREVELPGPKLQLDPARPEETGFAPTAVVQEAAAEGDFSATSVERLLLKATPRELAREIAKHVTIIQQHGGVIRLELHLVPPQLGKVAVKLRFADDKLKVHFIAAEVAAKEVLVASLSDLRTELSRMGIQLGEAHVSVSHEFGSGDFERSAGSGATGTWPAREVAATTASESASGDEGVNYLI